MRIVRLALFLPLLFDGCAEAPSPAAPARVPRPRAPCAERVPTRVPLYGDLHVHTAFSFDARSYDTVVTPADAYRFARGEAILLPPLDASGKGTREARIDRPLDFVAVTDHGEFLGEMYHCMTPTSPKYDTFTCQTYREEVGQGASTFAVRLSQANPTRVAELCGEGKDCEAAARERWQAMQDAAEAAYDRTASCSFTTFVGYEYTNTFGISNLHRNVIFVNDIVPDLPVTYFEAPTPLDLWTLLRDGCKNAENGCDVLVLPHNSNLSNGRLFDPTYPGGATIEEEASRAALRAEMEPVAEIFQHKGSSECRNGFLDVEAEVDPLCDFEELRPDDDEQCGDKPGSGGMRLWGCTHRHDFLRYVLKTGLLEAERLGTNPFSFGLIGSTDTHNGTPGNTSSVGFPGHVGLVDDTPEKRLGAGTETHDGVINNPGGLAGVWAEENSRESIFESIRRRETFATSGPRIPIRFFGGFGYDAGLCGRPERLEEAYAAGVPMGGMLGASSGSDPTFFVQASADPGTASWPGRPLERLQIIKGYVREGKVYEKVYDVAGTAAQEPSVDTSTCEVLAEGAAELCVVWTDPDFDPKERAFYYARAVEVPSCRYSTYECNELDPASAPVACADASVPKTVQHRAWSSPIWYGP
ncbi:DUF3604 domain-containing protein [Polyangium sp. y55x31]|uniref:DUF3604 domain-containing protein n=1 Tax=Polyangium sp. y55x31 TaxID=3042688 RepID=UPI002482EF6F|nr:DUF3604 domain-containing protein [Polyangium sp. y55x31]MDI1476816.1 DUF3604 domain-containing protein [Polyangium sp. y55x31]